MIKAIYNKPIANIELNDEKLKTIPLKSETRQGWTFSPQLLNIVLQALIRAIGQLKETKGIQIVLYHLLVYISDPLNSTRELLQLINTFIEVAEYKISSKQNSNFPI